MKERWQKIADRINAFSARERVMVMAALLAGVLGVWNLFFLMPYEQREEDNSAAIERLQSQVAALSAQAEGIVGRAQTDPDQALRERRAALEAQLQRLNERVRERTGEFVSPREMVAVLEDLLSAQRGLRLLRLESLPPERLSLGEGGGEVTVYRHGLLLEFSGDYSSTLRYLEALEDLPWHFFWDRLEYRLEQHPRARVILLLRTLSEREDWLSV